MKMTDATQIPEPTDAAPPADPPTEPAAPPEEGAGGPPEPPEEGKGDGDPQAPEDKKTPVWPDEWRQTIAKHASAGDEKAYKRELKALERYVDPSAIYGKAREAEGKLTSGRLVSIPDGKSSPEQVKDYHKLIGVPETAAEYLGEGLVLDNGAIIGEADKDLVESLSAKMHEAGATQGQMNSLLNWYYATEEDRAATLDDEDDRYKTTSTTALKEEMGPSYNRMTNSIAGLFSTAPGGTDPENPEGLLSRLMAGRMASGEIIGNDPDMVRFMVGLAQEMNPAQTATEDGDMSGTSMYEKIKELEGRMRTDRRAYFKDEPAQAEYRRLVTARDKHEAQQKR